MLQNSNQEMGAFITRLAFGSVLLSHGLLKAFVFTVPGTVGYFSGLGLPAIAAYLTIFGELAGGLAILSGFYTRLAAILSMPLLIGATAVHSGNGWVFSNEGGGWEFPLFLVVIATVVAIQGSGAYAIGRIQQLDRFIPEILR